MTEVNTHGLTLLVDPMCLDDYEILLLLKKLDQKQMQYIPDVIRKLLGEEQEQKVIDAMIKDHGRCRISDMSEIVNEVIDQLTKQDDTAKK